MIHLKLVCTPRSCIQKTYFRPAYYCTVVSDNVTVSFADKYDSKIVENGKYDKWVKLGYFQPKDPVESRTFSMILPPPNITGTLHLGHALTITLQDIMCRWKRMQGYSVLWVPGTDHAGIATQVMVEKHLQGKTGQNRHEIGRDKFLDLAHKWKKEKMDKINQQVRELGASVDWSRYFFTMDLNQSEAVEEAVIRLFDNGLLYKENSIVNWSSYLMSTVSDYEIVYKCIEKGTKLVVPGCEKPVEFGKIYDFVYKVVDSDETIRVSTTRLETIFGDTAVAVNPEDQRYCHLRGALVHHPFRNTTIPVIMDKIVDISFGTGALKITPAHSKVDFDVGKRHNLPVINILTESGHLNDECGEFANLFRFDVKEKVLTRLSELGLLRDVKDHKVQLPVCGRTGDVIENMVKSQWFIKCNELAKRAVSIVENGNLQIEPEKYKEFYFRWLNDHQDWCISRQLWWGHQLPLYKTEFGWVAATSEANAKVKAKEKFGKDCHQIERDKDVLDTWFSSALLPFSALGWPKGSDDFKKFYPLDLMETGSDILNFWVIRMVLLGLYFTDSIPFKKVLLHGMLCDSRGRKMSKSKGNVIEFDNVINGITLKELNDVVRANHEAGLLSETELKYALKFQKELFPNGIAPCGADALRLTLSSLESKDQVLNFNPVMCRENSAFCNKMWQASKFIIGWNSNLQTFDAILPNPQFHWQQWLLHRLSNTVDVMNDGLEKTDFDVASRALKKFFINDMCDTYVELAKPVLKNENRKDALDTIIIAKYCLETVLRLAAPFMPFICEELYSYLPMQNHRDIWRQSYPKPEEYKLWKNNKVDEEMHLVKELVSNARALIQLLKCKKNECEIVLFSNKNQFLRQYCKEMLTLIRCKSFAFEDQSRNEPTLVSTYKNVATLHLIRPQIVTTEAIMTNLKMLQQQIYHPRKEINEKLESKKFQDNSYKTTLQKILSEWTVLQTEINSFFETCCNRNDLKLENLNKAAKYVPQVYDLKYRLTEELKIE